VDAEAAAASCPRHGVQASLRPTAGPGRRPCPVWRAGRGRLGGRLESRGGRRGFPVSDTAQ
jgi:hypothetical protein